MKTLGENIKMLRKSRGLTQPQLAKIVGVSSYTTVSKWESNENSPRGRELVSLCNYFNVSSDDLLGITDGLSVQQHSDYNFFPSTISAGKTTNVDGVTNAEKISIPDSVMGKYAGNNNIYITRVNGESMNKTIPHNSLIAVKPIELSELKDEDIVVYSHNHEYGVKRFLQNENEIWFRPHSTDFRFRDDIYDLDNVDGLEIHGKVVVYIVELD